jgi:transcriptional regulator with XRE-family HTH domain
MGGEKVHGSRFTVHGLAERILHIRARRGWTMAQLADRLGVKKSTVCRWEAGVSRPRAVAMVRIEALERGDHS